jgi:mannose-6-phosphate isomerase-like protein (cupin superfamily)
MAAQHLGEHPIHLGLGATAVPQPAFTGMAWYGAYVARHGADGAEGRLVSQHRFTESWDSWEMHPAGDEVVFLISGDVLLHQEFPDGTAAQVRLTTGEYAINPPGAWHTMDLVSSEASALFITAGLGTEHRPR